MKRTADAACDAGGGLAAASELPLLADIDSSVSIPFAEEVGVRSAE